MANPHLDDDEDLTDLIAAAAGRQAVDYDDDLEDEGHSASVGFEAPTQPTFAVPESDERAEALEAFSSARVAMVAGQLSHARSLLEQAARLDPTDERYHRYLEDVRERERKENLRGTLIAIREEVEGRPAERPPLWTPRRIVAAAVLVLVAGFGAYAMRPHADRVDVADDWRHLARFESLYAAPDGGWIARVDEPLYSQSPLARQERCGQLLDALPHTPVPALVMRTTDGISIACSR